MAWTAIIYTDIYQSDRRSYQQISKQIVHDTIRHSSHIVTNNFIRRKVELHPIENEISSVRNKVFIRTKKTKEKWVNKKNDKFKEGTVVELNSTDTTTLKRVPGIGSTFAKRIVKFRDLLGGFYSADQIREVYGIDEERYTSLRKWFTADSSLIIPIHLNHLTAKEIARHPYISYKQARIIENIVKRKGPIKNFGELSLLDEFNEKNSDRIRHYLSFE